ncbi:hypothetical protein CRG98_008804 [Punica granatum]|uniref:G-patch domain-containing protein n=1 Tax=Punica granatum TaxID=22663 RepID=A0A2I0KQT3_PUNGR|nr:hypothetical protein CRG98_008804 [Punica granatum]
MAELFALLRGPNRASSSSTPPSGQGPTADPTSWILPTQVPENTDAPAPPTTHMAAAHPFTIPFPPPPAPAAVPLPPAAFLTLDQVLSSPPLVSMSTPAAVYTVPPPMAEDIPTWEDLSRKFIDQYQYCAETPLTLLELSMKEMAQGQRLEEYATKWHAQAAKHIPPISKVQQIQLFHSTLRGVYYSHLLAHTSSFSDLIEAGKKLDLGIKLGRMEGPTSKGEESLKKAPAMTTPSSGRRGKEVAVNAVNPAHPAPQQYSMNFTSAPPVVPSYAPHVPQYRPQPPTQPIYYSALPPSPPSTVPSPVVHHYVPTPLQAPQYQPPALRVSQPTQRVPPLQGQQGDAAQPRPRRQYLSLPVPLAHIYRQLRPLTKGMHPPRKPRRYPESRLLRPRSSEPHREALLRVLTATQVPKGTSPDRIEETINSIFSNTISFSDDELPSEGCAHSRALHIVCKCNNHIVGRVMIDTGSALNVCPVTTLKQMNVDLNRVRPSKTAVRAFDGSRREVNGEIDLLIDVDPCSFSVTFQVLDILNAFSLLLGRPWIHSAGAIPSSLHQKLKFIVEERIIMVKGEEDYAIYKETAVPYINVGNDENLPFHSFETISVIRDYGGDGPSRVDCMIGKVLLRHNYIPGTGLGVRGQGINRPIEVEEYKHRRGLGSRPSCHEIIEARRGNHLHRLAMHYGRLNRGMQVPLLSHFFPGPSLIIGNTLDGPSSDFDDTPDGLSTVYAVTEEIPSGVHIRPAQENEELNNWTSVPRYSAVIADVLHSNPNHRHVDSNPSEECLGEPGPIYFGEGLDEDSQVPEIEESLRRLEDRQLTSLEPTEEINVGTEHEPRTLKIGTGLDLTQQARMIDFLTRYQEVFAWSYADMPGLDPSIVKHFLPLDTKKFPPKRQQLRRQPPPPHQRGGCQADQRGLPRSL